jgi:hypothetical protein
MNDEFDPLIDKAIESEKQQALRHFHLSPISLSPSQTGKVSGHSSTLRLTRTWIWGGCAAMLLLSFGAILMVHYNDRPSIGRVNSRTIEQALVSVQRNQPGPALPTPPSFSGDKASSDLSWNIQSAICRVRRSHYSKQDLGEAVMRTLYRGATPSRPMAGLDKYVVQGLDLKLRQLSSNNSVARVLSKPVHSQ